MSITMIKIDYVSKRAKILLKGLKAEQEAMGMLPYPFSLLKVALIREATKEKLENLRRNAQLKMYNLKRRGNET